MNSLSCTNTLDPFTPEREIVADNPNQPMTTCDSREYRARVPKPPPELSLSDWAVLAIVAEAPTHGWPIVRELRGDGSLGRVWTVSRAVVYRSITTLLARGLIEERGDQPGVQGPQRTILRATRSGRTALRRWLDTPVAHVRDVRTELLLKLAILDRTGRPTHAVVQRQREALEPVIEAMSGRVQGQGFDRVLAQWRREQAGAVDRFLRSLAGQRRSRSD
jgi:DNA-binding PadR family transcriptional regulator